MVAKGLQWLQWLQLYAAADRQKAFSANSRPKAFLSDACNKISSTMQTFLISARAIRKVCMVDDIWLRASDRKAFGRLSAEKLFCLPAAAYLTYNCNHCNLLLHASRSKWAVCGIPQVRDLARLEVIRGFSSQPGWRVCGQP